MNIHLERKLRRVLENSAFRHRDISMVIVEIDKIVKGLLRRNHVFDIDQLHTILTTYNTDYKNKNFVMQVAEMINKQIRTEDRYEDIVYD